MKTNRTPTLLLLILCATPLVADPEPEILRADLDADGKQEIVTWEQFAETEDEGAFYQLKVLDDDGTLLWESPKVKDSDNPLVFGNWDFGWSLPEIIADIDGDGAVELVAPAPQSDVSPTCFRVLRWKGGRFVPVRSALLLESPRGSGEFPWTKAEAMEGTWLSSFKKANPDGTFRVEVFRFRDEATSIGEAVLSRTPKGFQIKKWAVPMKPLSDAIENNEAVPPPAPGSVVYRARLGRNDHFNSAGEHLDSVGAILRQDRANFHKGTGDAEDGADPLFTTPAARNGMDARKPVPVGSGKTAWRKTILTGTPLVEVEVTDSELKVKILQK